MNHFKELPMVRCAATCSTPNVDFRAVLAQNGPAREQDAQRADLHAVETRA